MDSKQQEFEQQLEEFVERRPEFTTPGAKHYFKRVWIGYLVLAIAIISGLYGTYQISNSSEKNAKATCALLDRFIGSNIQLRDTQNATAEALTQSRARYIETNAKLSTFLRKAIKANPDVEVQGRQFLDLFVSTIDSNVVLQKDSQGIAIATLEVANEVIKDWKAFRSTLDCRE